MANETENIETVKRCYEAFSRGEIDAVLACMSPELTRFGVVTRAGSAVPWYISLTTKSEVPKFFAALAQSVEHTRFEPFAFAAAGEYVYVTIDIQQRLRASGEIVDHQVIHRFRIRGGKIVECRALEDTLSLDAAFRRNRPAGAGSRHVRMVTVPVKPGMLDEVVAYWTAKVGPSASEHKGYVSARLLVDRAANRVRSIGVWESEADYQATVSWTQEHLKRIANHFAGPPTIDGFDLAAEFARDDAA